MAPTDHLETKVYKLRRISQPVEKAGIVLIATTNRAHNAPKSARLAPFGARFGTNMNSTDLAIKRLV